MFAAQITACHMGLTTSQLKKQFDNGIIQMQGQKGQLVLTMQYRVQLNQRNGEKNAMETVTLGNFPSLEPGFASYVVVKVSSALYGACDQLAPPTRKPTCRSCGNEQDRAPHS